MAQRRSILVVDDELGPRESLRMILKPIYEVQTAANGQEALQFIDREKFDLVTLDLKMPGMPGLDVLREIKKHRGDVEVIIITGYGTLANATEAIRCGAVDFISKPFNVADIVAVVGRSIERRNLQSQMKDLGQKSKGSSRTGEN